MRPDSFGELLRNSFSFISEKLSSHDIPDAEDTEDDSDQLFSSEPSPLPQIALTVDRIKPTRAGNSTTACYNPDYELIWRDDPRAYISPNGFEAVASLLRAWSDDIAAGNVSRCRDTEQIVGRFGSSESSSRGESRLSVVIHNMMFERYGYNTEQAWQETVAELLKNLEALETWIATFYAPKNLTAMRFDGTVPYKELSASVQQYWDSSCGLCEMASFLAFAILQTDQWGHPGMHLAQLSLMKMLVDLEAFHRQQPMLSFVRVEREEHPPGYFYNEDDNMLELVTAKQLHDVWHYRRDRLVDGGQYRPRQPCLRYIESDAEQQSENAAAREQMIRAAAASIKAAQRYTDGSHPLLIRPSQSLLYARYRSSSIGVGLFAHERLPPVAKTYPISAKRKAQVAPPDPRRFKRGRVGRDLISEIERARAEEAAAAAAIPLPPSPAVTEPSSDGEENDEADKSFVSQPPQRPPLDAIFASDEEEEGPRLKISSAKAEELRLVVEERRAAREEAQRRREEERRRKEEERKRKAEEERLLKLGGLRPPCRRAIAPLSEAWHTRVNAAVHGDPRKEVAVSPEGTPLKGSDFGTVVMKSEWLNDEIVNGFLLHLARYINNKAGITNPKKETPRCHAFTSFFWKALSTKGAAGTERWMKRVGVTRENFLQIETMLIPICEHNHWTLVVVRPRQATVSHMDSMGSGGGRRVVTDTVLRWVKEFLQERFTSRWRVQQVDSPRQTNGWDCGVHTVTNALFVSLGLDPACYAAKEMSLQRDRIAATLINGGFSGDLDLAGL